MPTWGDLLGELNRRAAATGILPIDEIRREALTTLYSITHRPTVVYASRWIQGGGQPQDLMIGIGDVHAFMQVLHGIPGPSLDLVLHSSGGSPMAAEAIVEYLRTRFSDLRVLVPLAAMSAATMIACSANRIVMGKHSFLGPVDPQLILETPLGTQAVPAQAIRDQFNLAQQASGSASQFPAWIPMLQQYGPGLIVQCDNVLRLSEQLVETWLQRWMFAGDPAAQAKAQTAARQLNSHNHHLVHGRFLNRDAIRSYGLIVEDLEADQAFQDAVLTVLHAFTHTFSFNGSVMKIFENHLGQAFITARVAPQAPLPQPPRPPAPPGP